MHGTDLRSDLHGQHRGGLEGVNLRRLVIRSATGVYGLRIVAQVTAFVTTVILARVLGASGYGTFRFVLASVTVLGIPAVLGLDQLLIREIAKLSARKQWNLVRGMIGWTNRVALIASAVAAIAAFVVVPRYLLADRPEYVAPFAAALLLVPVLALTKLRRACLQGFHQMIRSVVPELIVRNGLFLLFIAIGFVFFRSRVGLVEVVWLRLGAETAAFLVGAFLVRYTIRQLVPSGPPKQLTREWLKRAGSFTMISGLQVGWQQTATIMLGLFATAESVGVFNVALRLTDPIFLLLSAANAVVNPIIAELYDKNQLRRLQRVATLSARGVLAASLLGSVLLVVAAEPVLRLFGGEFQNGRGPLLVILFVRVLSAATGSVGPVLTMTEYERHAAVSFGGSIVLNVILGVLLIPEHGAMGAAFAWAVATTLWNIFMAVWVKYKVGVNTTAFGRIPK